MKNLHLPLPDEILATLREVSARCNRPAAWLAKRSKPGLVNGNRNSSIAKFFNSPYTRVDRKSILTLSLSLPPANISAGGPSGKGEARRSLWARSPAAVRLRTKG
ncbi:MAG: hypothetical protein ACK6DX_03615, partial [Acidobacteriota bacterium]